MYQRVFVDVEHEGSVEDLPDVFIHVLADGKPVSFVRIRNLQRFAEAAHYSDVPLAHDRAFVDKKAYWEAGGLNMRLLVRRVEEVASVLRGGSVAQSRADLVQVPWSQPPVFDQSRMRPLLIVANLYMGSNLISADENGLCDPTVLFDHHGVQARSSVFRNSINPVWSERIPIKTFYSDDYLPPLVVKLFDLDENTFSSDDYECLGMGTITLAHKDVSRSAELNELPRFIRFPIEDNLKLRTAVLTMSLSLIDNQQGLDITRLRRMSLPKLNFKVKVHILGLRDMKSGGLFPVKNPYIKFHVGALKGSDKSSGNSAFDILTAKCKKGGPDASFAEVVW